MAIIVWQGTAAAVAQSDDIQVTAFDAGTTYTISVGGVEVANAAGNSSANQTATDLAASWQTNRAAHPYSANISAAANTDTITLTHDTAGVQFIVTTAASGGNGTIGNAAANVTLAGPNVWATAANWSTHNTPTSSDEVVIPPNTPPIVALPSSAQELAGLDVRFGAPNIGRDSTSFTTDAAATTASTTAKAEYRPCYLPVDINGTITYGAGTAPSWASRRHLIDQQDTTGSTLDVITTPSTSADAARGAPALRYLAASANANVNVRTSGTGGVGIAMDSAGETSTVGTVDVSDSTTQARVLTGRGLTISNWRQSGGTNVLRATAGTPVVRGTGGQLTLDGVFAAGNVTVDGATIIPNNVVESGNSAATVTVNSGTLDLQQTKRARAFAATVHNGGTIRDEPSVDLGTHTRTRATITAS